MKCVVGMSLWRGSFPKAAPSHPLEKEEDFRTLWGGLVTAEVVVLRIETLTLQSSSGVCSAVLELSDELHRSVVELLNLPAPSELAGESGAKKKTKKKQGS
jgi:hypothetical protein